MKKITNLFIFNTSDEASDLIADLKERGIPLENIIQQNNEICLNIENTSLFVTLSETETYNETTLIYSLYYNNKRLATTVKKINPSDETCSTKIDEQVYLIPSPLPSPSVSIMKPKDYLNLQQAYEKAFWHEDKKNTIQLELEQSLISPANVSAFNEHATALFKNCNSVLAEKTSQTSFSGFGRQFSDREQNLILQSKFLLEYLSWFTPENKNLAKTLGLEFLRTITNGYSFLPSQSCKVLFTEPVHKKACIDNFVKFARRSFESRDKSGEWRENEQSRFNSFIDFAMLNDLNREMDNDQRKHFFDTIHLINSVYNLPTKTLMLFNSDNDIDRSIFNEIVEKFVGKKRGGLFSNLREATKTELTHLKEMLPQDKMQFFEKYFQKLNAETPALNRYSLYASTSEVKTEPLEQQNMGLRNPS